MARASFPPERTSFVGRSAELAALDARVADGARLLSLVGPPGAGKTRLARRFAGRSIDARSVEDAWFVEAAELRSGEELIDAIASALEFSMDRGAPLATSIERAAEAIDARGRVLLVLDNLEQLVDAAASIVARLLDRAPEARIVVTTRDRLRVEGEVVFDVQPLAEVDARTLFMDRARAVAPTWTPDAADLAAIDELVARLDRLPLAIELAAGRAHVLRPAALLARLGDRLHVLSTTRRDVVARQASLAAAIDASWVLLSDWERDALRQSAVFSGGFTIEAAEAVIDLGAHVDAPSVGDAVQALVDRSLLRADGARLSMYEMIRSYAAEKLGDARPAVEERHARWIVEAAEGWSKSGEIARLAEEHRNLDVAYRAMRDRDPRLAARAVLALEPLVHRRGSYAALVGRIDDLLGTTEISADPRSTASLVRARAEARRVRGEVAEALLDLRRARALAEEANDELLAARIVRVLAPLEGGEDVASSLQSAMQIAEARGDDVLAGEIACRLGLHAFERGDAEGARGWYDRATSLARQAKSAWLEAIACTISGTLAVSEHRFDDAKNALEKAVSLHRALGDRRQEGAALSHLVGLHHERGDLDEAWRCSQRALSLHREVGDKLFEGGARLAMGMLELERAHHDEAAAHLLEALAVFDEIGDARYAAIARAWLGFASLDRGDVDEARRRLDEARDAASSASDPHTVALVEALLALLARGDEARRRLETARLSAGDRPRAAIAELLRAIADHLGNKPISPPRSVEARLARRILERVEVERPPPRSTRALVVGDGGRWFVLDGGERVDLTRRRSLRLMLARLADERVRAVGRPLSIDDLLAAGWPGEHVRPDAGASRVYVAVRTLRRLGLDALRTSGDGYLLDPDVSLSRA